MELGYIKMTFTPKGRINGAEFHRMNLTGMPNINPIKSDTDENKIAEVAKSCMADVFAMVNQIELANPEVEKINSVPYNIKRYDNGIIKEVCVRFSLEPVK